MIFFNNSDCEYQLHILSVITATHLYMNLEWYNYNFVVCLEKFPILGFTTQI